MDITYLPSMVLVIDIYRGANRTITITTSAPGHTENYCSDNVSSQTYHCLRPRYAMSILAGRYQTDESQEAGRILSRS